MRNPPEPTPPPERLGAYRFESRLGGGGMGEVYLAHDERLDRRVALKRIRPDGMITANERARFRREARAAAALGHPAIVQIFDVLETEDGDWIVMECIEGSTLRELTAGRPLSPALAASLACEIVEGLAEAHAKGFLHRDLKSDNVMVTPSGHAKILDFGLAGPIAATIDPEPLTATGALVGSPHAMAPELVAGGEASERSDLFAFGVLLYEMVTGTSPFAGRNLLETLQRISNDKRPRVGELLRYHQHAARRSSCW